MTVYVAVVEDRHVDPVVRVFSRRDTAVAWARKNFLACLAHPEMADEADGIEGHEWSAWYEPESDQAWVDKVTLDDDSDL